MIESPLTDGVLSAQGAPTQGEAREEELDQVQSVPVDEPQPQGTPKRGDEGEPSVKRYRCSSCRQTHATERQLEWHMKDAHYKEPYRCQKCGKSMLWRKSEAHAATHYPENYSCSSCGVMFRIRTTAIYHTNKDHSGDPQAQVVKGPARAEDLPDGDKDVISAPPSTTRRTGS